MDSNKPRPKRTRRGYRLKKANEIRIISSTGSGKTVNVTEAHSAGGVEQHSSGENSSGQREISISDKTSDRDDSDKAGSSSSASPARNVPGITGAVLAGGGGNDLPSTSKNATKRGHYTIDFKLTIVEKAKKSSNREIAR